MLSIEKLYQSLEASAEDDSLAGAVLLTRAEQLATHQEFANSGTTNEQLMQLFIRLEGVPTIPVVDHGEPIGLVNRNIFMEQYARPFVRDLYGRKSCIAFMDKSPLVVPHTLPIEELVKLAVGTGGKVLTDGFITTDNGQYQGVGSGFSLVKAMSDIEAEKTRQLLSSISYASLIQQSHLVESNGVLAQDLSDHGMLWEPRDVVGGDAYFFRRLDQGIFGCVFDCTGHGVPGAFMTLIVMSFLEQAVSTKEAEIDPGELLVRLNAYIKRVLQQDDRSLSDMDSGKKASNDGLDAAVFVLSEDQRNMRFASAKLGLLITEPDSSEVRIVEADKTPIGYSDSLLSTRWTTHQVSLVPGSLLVIPTDGVIDQIGGPKRIAHGRKRLVSFLSEHHGLSAKAFANLFKLAFDQWQGKERRRDDVSLLAFRTRS